jgi:hypothetical protein
MPITFPTCSTILFFRSFTDVGEICGIQHEFVAGQFPFRFRSSLDLHIFLDGESGHYETTYAVEDAAGKLIGQGVWANFHYNAAKPTTFVIGQPEFTVPELPQAGIYTMATLLRKDGHTATVGKYRIELKAGTPPARAADVFPVTSRPVGWIQAKFEEKH